MLIDGMNPSLQPDPNLIPLQTLQQQHLVFCFKLNTAAPRLKARKVAHQAKLKRK